MPRSASFIAFWLILAVAIAICAPLEAELIAELGPSRVIELEAPPLLEKVPVVSSVALAPGGDLLATAGDDHVVRIWDREGKLLRRLAAHDDWVRSAVFSPNGILATAGQDRRIQLWDTATDAPFRTLPEQIRGISTLVFSPDGGLLAAAGFESTVWLFDGKDGRLLRKLEAPGGDVRALVCSPDGTQLAAAGRSGLVRIWDLSSGRVIHDLAGHRRRVRALAYSPDSKKIASAGEDRNILIWDTAEGRLLETFPSRPGMVLSLTFCGPGLLAAGGSDNVIRVWDAAASSEQFRLVGHTGSVTALVWDQKTGTLVSGSFDTTVRLWHLRDSVISTVSHR